jgi:hypothetical protein
LDGRTIVAYLEKIELVEKLDGVEQRLWKSPGIGTYQSWQLTQLNRCLVELVYALYIKTFKVPQAVGNT